MKTKDWVIEIVAGLLILMFTYAASIKLMEYDQSKLQMMKQLIPAGTAPVLTWLVPVAELTIVGLLLFKKTRLIGLYASAGLMLLFSGYIAVAMSGWLGQKPCGCGGILEHMSYWQHLVFNLFFVGAAIASIILQKRSNANNNRFHFLERKEVTGLK